MQVFYLPRFNDALNSTNRDSFADDEQQRNDTAECVVFGCFYTFTKHTISTGQKEAGDIHSCPSFGNYAPNAVYVNGGWSVKPQSRGDASMIM